MNLVVGATGLLGSELMKMRDMEAATFRLEDNVDPKNYDVAFLCAGTKGFAECEGNRKAFRSDVDGNIRLGRTLWRSGTFVVFVSTDAVEWGLHTAYARNRFLVELALGGLPNIAIFRPGKFDNHNAVHVARACARVGINKIEGLTRWP